MMRLLRRFLKEESGPTAVEYALMLVLVAIAVALATPGIAQAVINVFTTMAGLLTP